MSEAASSQSPQTSALSPEELDAFTSKLVTALKTVYDPEIPVNIVDLGLVYKCEVTRLSDAEGDNRVEVRFTLTAPGCGMGDVLREDIRAKLAAIPGIREADVQVLFDPPWNMSMMSDAAKLQLGML